MSMSFSWVDACSQMVSERCKSGSACLYCACWRRCFWQCNQGSSSHLGNTPRLVGNEIIRQKKHVVKRVSIHVVIVMQEVADADAFLPEVHVPLRQSISWSCFLVSKIL